MLQWNDLHPYSAIHVVQIPGALEERRLRSGIAAVLEARGLTNLTLNRAKAGFCYENGPASCEVKLLPGSEDPRPALYAEMERQLNTPFLSAERFSPFRFFAAPASDSFFLGLTYFHPAADAESVVLLLKDLAEAYLKKVSPQDLTALDVYPDNRSHLLGRHARVLMRRVARLPQQIRLMRRSQRPPYRAVGDFRNGFTFFSLAPESLRALIWAGKSWHVTVNDLLMALLMKALSPLAGKRLQAKKRRNISLGCSVNLRRDLEVDSRRTFGLFLGSFAVTHAVPEELGLRMLAGDIGRQTLAIKQDKLYLGTPLELGFARFMQRFLAPALRKSFYQKNYPLWGGITNMNLNALWGGPGEPGPMDYFRGVSTGPATPLVLSVTTVRDRANIGLSYRSTVFTPEDIENVKGRFVNQLERVKESA
jgi:hypothetical protein